MEALQTAYFPEAKNAVIEKYITLCKNVYVDRMMRWRMNLLSLNLTEQEQSWLKLGMNSINKLEDEHAEYKQLQANWQTSNFQNQAIFDIPDEKIDYYGHIVENIFPLLDPDLAFEEALKRHQEGWVTPFPVYDEVSPENRRQSIKRLSTVQQ